MSDDGFVELAGTRWTNTTVPFVLVQGGGVPLHVSKAAITAIGSPGRVVFRANPTTGEVRIVPSEDAWNSLKVTDGSQVAGQRLNAFCKEHGFAYGHYPAEIKDGMVVFRLQRKAEDR